jgi:DNA repair protein RAD5
VTVEKLIFSKAEQMIYDSVYLDAKRKFQQLDDQGLVNKNYTNILAMLMKLRRAVLHPTLVQGADLEEGDDAGTSKAKSVIKQSQDDIERNETFAQGVQDNLASISETECPICLDVSENPVLVPGCMHQGYVLSMTISRPCSCVFAVARIASSPSWIHVPPRERTDAVLLVRRVLFR